MTQKHLLTAFHCLVAAVLTPVGLALANSIADQRPNAALVLFWASIVLPVLIATRVAWATGYAAGRTEAQQGFVPDQLAPPPTATAAGDDRIRSLSGGRQEVTR
jgi:hypothetical protein